MFKLALFCGRRQGVALACNSIHLRQKLIICCIDISRRLKERELLWHSCKKRWRSRSSGKHDLPSKKTSPSRALDSIKWDRMRLPVHLLCVLWPRLHSRLQEIMDKVVYYHLIFLTSFALLLFLFPFFLPVTLGIIRRRGPRPPSAKHKAHAGIHACKCRCGKQGSNTWRLPDITCTSGSVATFFCRYDHWWSRSIAHAAHGWNTVVVLCLWSAQGCCQPWDSILIHSLR